MRVSATGHGKRNHLKTNPKRSISFSTSLASSPAASFLPLPCPVIYETLDASEASAPTDICKHRVSAGAQLQKPGPQRYPSKTAPRKANLFFFLFPLQFNPRQKGSCTVSQS